MKRACARSLDKKSDWKVVGDNTMQSLASTIFMHVIASFMIRATYLGRLTELDVIGSSPAEIVRHVPLCLTARRRWPFFFLLIRSIRSATHDDAYNTCYTLSDIIDQRQYRRNRIRIANMVWCMSENCSPVRHLQPMADVQRSLLRNLDR